MVVPPFKPSRTGKIIGAVDSESSTAFEGLSVDLHESATISSLKELIAKGDERLEQILKMITDGARQLTGGTGAALAMWKDGAMICRARSGDTAPPIGAQLSAETGISGQCLRSGQVQNCADTENDPLVDIEVCRSLGLRSIAVLPIQGWRGVNGILEVFSTRPAAFTAEHIGLLEQLAALAERARASQPHGASAVAPKVASENDQEMSSGLLPASDRVGDVALAFVNHRSRPFVMGGIGVGVLALLALVIWLPWRGSDDEGRAHAAAPISSSSSAAPSSGSSPSASSPSVSVKDAGGSSASPNAATAESFTAHPPDNDPIWKPNPGGQALFVANGKPSAGTPVKLASSVDVVPGKKSSAGRAPMLASLADKVAIPRGAPAGKAEATELASAGTEPPEPPLLAANAAANRSDISGVLPARAPLPGLSLPVSQGVSGGQLLHRVSPVYPAQARELRLAGTVVLSAMVMEDGTVRDVKAVEGAPALAESAVEAVRQWRYRPYQLDGKAIKNEVQIKVEFKVPEAGH